MSQTIYHYRVFCQTESIFVRSWDKEAPTHCCNNNTHTIDTNSITIIDSVSNNEVKILQSVPGFTNGLYKAEGFKLSIPANSTAYLDMSWPYNISIMTVNYTPSTDNIGDHVTGSASPNTTIGVITQTLAQNVSVINVNSTVLQHIVVGYNVKIVNQNQSVNMGECIAIDTENSRITCNTSCSESIGAGSYVQVSRSIFKNIYFPTSNPINLASKSVASTAFTANTVARLTYTNTSNVDKTFSFYCEYEY